MAAMFLKADGKPNPLHLYVSECKNDGIVEHTSLHAFVDPILLWGWMDVMADGLLRSLPAVAGFLLSTRPLSTTIHEGFPTRLVNLFAFCKRRRLAPATRQCQI